MPTRCVSRPEAAVTDGRRATSVGARAEHAPGDAIIPAMSEPTPPTPPSRPLTPLKTADTGDKMLCERCGAEMYRMHAVWRCPSCGFKTDCCGW
jgi:hypothetical protein